MSPGKKILIAIIAVLLSIGLSVPWQKVAEPILLGFIPTSVFYLLLVHFLFVVFIAWLAFKVKLHGRVEDEETFLAQIKAERGKP